MPATSLSLLSRIVSSIFLCLDWPADGARGAPDMVAENWGWHVASIVLARAFAYPVAFAASAVRGMSVLFLFCSVVA